ncbi:MAG: ribosomal L7Ae/L30e/S12e/Gadd45 family protein [Selenomonadales bacterium]|nr:ribosomal L7Ae/L30e/S12e/Gadd45 family protein [Selenomonadales bacterium]
MSLERLKNGKKVIGIKQTTKAVTKNIAICVFLADDADERVLAPLRTLCEANEVEVVRVSDMKSLGLACSIAVGAAAAAIVRQA